MHHCGKGVGSEFLSKKSGSGFVTQSGTTHVTYHIMIHIIISIHINMILCDLALITKHTNCIDLSMMQQHRLDGSQVPWACLLLFPHL